MKQSGLFRCSIRSIVTVVVLVSLWATTLVHANRVIGDKRFIPIDCDGLVTYVMDLTNVKQYTGLSGNMLVDVWIEGRFNAGAGKKIQTFLGGYPSGVDYEKVGTVKARYLFKIDAQKLERASLAAVIERKYLDLNGEVIGYNPFNPQGFKFEWHSLNETEAKALQKLLQRETLRTLADLDPALRSSSAVKELNEDFLGRPWGTRPVEFADAIHIADLVPNRMVFATNLNLSPILGPVSDDTAPRLIFTRDNGLVKAHISFSVRDYDVVYSHLVKILGEPVPIMYELWAARVDFDSRSEWQVGQNTKVVLTSRLSGATLEIGRRDIFATEGRGFEEVLSKAQLKKAAEYERQNRILEASSLYQNLLNSTDSSPYFTQIAQERLVAYSVINDAVEFIGKDRGFTFRSLRNILSGTPPQHWLRIDLDQEAQEALLKQRVDEIKPQDGLVNIIAVLCRIKADKTEGKYRVVEQVWLDKNNRIVGGSPAWASQDVVWPAPYIKKVCEEFLKAWFSFETTSSIVR